MINIAYFSCDATQDSLHYSVKSLIRFIDEEFRIYVPYNEVIPEDLEHENVVFIKVSRSNWREESIEFLNIIKSEVDSIMLILDDFFIFDMTVDKLKLEYEEFAKERSMYKLLIPYKESIFRKIYYSVCALRGVRYVSAASQYPFKASLQIAFWNVEYLISLVKASNNIWHFENLPSRKIHYCRTSPLLRYTHLVEKGEWQEFSKRVIENAGFEFQTGKRIMRKIPIGQKVKDTVSKFIQFFVGYYIHEKLGKFDE